MFKKNRQEDCAEALAQFEAEALPHLDKLFRLAMWLFRDCSRAEQLVKKTLTEALGTFHQFDRDTNCHAWLIRIMFAVKSKRQRSWSTLRVLESVDRTEERIAETTAFDAPTSENVDEAELLRVLERLPVELQEVIVLSDTQGLTYKEIADALSLPVAVVMTWLTRARKMLRMELAAEVNRRESDVARADESASESFASRTRVKR